MITIFSTIIFCDCATRISIFFSSFQVFFSPFRFFCCSVLLLFDFMKKKTKNYRELIDFIYLSKRDEWIHKRKRSEAESRSPPLISIGRHCFYCGCVPSVYTAHARARQLLCVCVCVCRERQRVCKSDDFLGISATLCFFALGFRV